MRYGTDSTRERHNDRGGPSSDTNSQESLRGLAKRYGVNPKTIAKWKARSSVSAKADKLFFLDRRGQFEGFEIWERTRSVFGHPNRDAAKPAVNQSPRARLADDIPERIRSAPWITE